MFDFKLKTFITALLCSTLCIYSSANAEELVLSGSEGHPMTQYSARVLSLAYELIGLDMSPVVLPPARSLIMANNGNVDGELFRSYRIEENYRKLIRVPVVLGYGEIVVMTQKKYMVVENWSDLEKYSIASLIGVPIIEEKTRGSNIYFLSGADNLILQVLTGHTEAVVAPKSVLLAGLDSLVANGIHKKLPIDDLYFLDSPLERNAYYHYLNEKNIDLLEGITKALVHLEEDGILRAIKLDESLNQFPALKEYYLSDPDCRICILLGGE